MFLSEIVTFYSSYLLWTAWPEHVSTELLSIPCSDILSRLPPRQIRNCVYSTAVVFPAGSLECIGSALSKFSGS